MAMPADTEVTSSSEVAVTDTSRSASAVTPESIAASVDLVTTITSAPTPTPAVPPAASEPATETMLLRSEACTLTLPPEPGLAPPWALTVAPWPTVALVVSSSTMMVAAPATPAVPPTPPAAVSEIRSSVEVAPTSTPAEPAAVTWPRSPTRDSTVSVCTSVVLAMPTPALPPPTPMPPAISSVCSVPSDRTVTFPPACSRVWPLLASATKARVLVSCTCTAIDAATPTELPLRPKVAAIEVMSSSESALSRMWPPVAVRLAFAPTQAEVWRTITPTSRPMPTPVPLVLAASPPAALNSLTESVASTEMFWLAVTVV